MKPLASTQSTADFPLLIPTQSAHPTARLILRNDVGQVIQQWLVKQNKCTLGSAAGCAIRCDLPGIAPYHVLLVVGARQIFIRALAPKLARNGRPFNEVLLTGDDNHFEIAGHRFELSRNIQSGVRDAEQDASARSRLKFTLARPFELSNRQSIPSERSAGEPQPQNAPSTRPAGNEAQWVAQLVQAAIQPLECQLHNLLEPLTQLQAESRKQQRLRRKRSAAKRRGELPTGAIAEANEKVLQRLQDRSDAHFTKYVEEMAAKHSSSTQVLGEKIADINAQISALEQIIAIERRTEDSSTREIDLQPQIDLQNRSIEQLQSGLVTVSSAINNLQTAQTQQSADHQGWRHEIQEQLSALTLVIERLSSRISEVQANATLLLESRREETRQMREVEARQSLKAEQPAESQSHPIAAESVIEVVDDLWTLREDTDGQRMQAKPALVSPAEDFGDKTPGDTSAGYDSTDGSGEVESAVSSQQDYIAQQTAADARPTDCASVVATEPSATEPKRELPILLEEPVAEAVTEDEQAAPQPTSEPSSADEFDILQTAMLDPSHDADEDIALEHAEPDVTAYPATDEVAIAEHRELTAEGASESETIDEQPATSSILATEIVDESEAGTKPSDVDLGSPLSADHVNQSSEESDHLEAQDHEEHLHIPSFSVTEGDAASENGVEESTSDGENEFASLSASEDEAWPADPSATEEAWTPNDPQSTDAARPVEETWPAADNTWSAQETWSPVESESTEAPWPAEESTWAAEEAWPTAEGMTADGMNEEADFPHFANEQLPDVADQQPQDEQPEQLPVNEFSDDDPLRSELSSIEELPVDQLWPPLETVGDARPREDVAGMDVSETREELPDWWRDDDDSESADQNHSSISYAADGQPIDFQAEASTASPSALPLAYSAGEVGQDEPIDPASVGETEDFYDPEFPTLRHAEHSDVAAQDTAEKPNKFFGSELADAAWETSDLSHGLQVEDELGESLANSDDDSAHLRSALLRADSQAIESTPATDIAPIIEAGQDIDSSEQALAHDSLEGTATSTEEDDSVEEYMRKLLARMRGVPEEEIKAQSKPEAKPPAAEAKPETGDTAPLEETTAETAPADPISQPTTAPLTVEPTEPFDPEKYMPRSLAPERNQDFALMRDLANSSARTAINKSTRQRHLSSVLLKVAVATIGLTVGCVLIAINGVNVNIGLVATVASFIVAAIWGYDAVVSLKPLLQAGLVLQPQVQVEATEGDDQPA